MSSPTPHPNSIIGGIAAPRRERRSSRSGLLRAAAAALAIAGATAACTATLPDRRTPGPPALNLPSFSEISPTEQAEQLHVLRYEEAIRQYGEPALVDEGDKLLEAQWKGRIAKQDCRMTMRFNRVTKILLQWSFDCK